MLFTPRVEICHRQKRFFRAINQIRPFNRRPLSAGAKYGTDDEATRVALDDGGGRDLFFQGGGGGEGHSFL